MKKKRSAMSGSPVLYLGLPIDAHNVNIKGFGNYYLGWDVFKELRPDDEERARRLLSFGLKADVGNFPTVPWGVFHRPRLLALLLESGFDFKELLHKAYIIGLYEEMLDIPPLSLRLLFEHGTELPRVWSSDVGMVHLKNRVFQPIYDGVQARRNRCRAASLAVCCIQRIRRRDRDVFGLVAKMVWKTRCSDGWNPSPPGDRFK